MVHLVLLRASRAVIVSAAPHLSVEELAGMIDGTLSPAERQRAEQHLAECDDCREELATSTQVVASGTPATVRRFPWRHLVPLAAGILLVVWIRRPAERARVTSEPERAAPVSSAHITTVAPAEDAAVGARALRFAWHPLESSTGYSVVVKDASGATVWKGDVADTVLALPDSVRLLPNTPYVWRVDGQREGGFTATSAEIGFRIAP